MTLSDPPRKITEIDIGPEESFEKLPAPVTIRLQDYFLARDDQGTYRLLSARCPHQWGVVMEWDNCFMCPDHGWRFELTEGICINGPNARMDFVPVIAREGHLIAQLPGPRIRAQT